VYNLKLVFVRVGLFPEAIDITDLQDQLDASEHDAQGRVADLAEERGGWRAEIGSWSVAECLDHLASCPSPAP
jgi:hypothetical protein